MIRSIAKRLSGKRRKRKRGNIDQAKSGQGKQTSESKVENPEAETDKSQDDSVVYTESKSKKGSKLRPSRRPESFNLKNPNKKPTSWQRVRSGSDIDNRAKPVSDRSLSATLSPTESGDTRVSVSYVPSPEAMHKQQHLAVGPQRMHSSKSVPALHQYGGRGRSDGSASFLSINPSTSWHGGPVKSNVNLSMPSSADQSLPSDARGPSVHGACDSFSDSSSRLSPHSSFYGDNSSDIDKSSSRISIDSRDNSRSYSANRSQGVGYSPDYVNKNWNNYENVEGAVTHERSWSDSRTHQETKITSSQITKQSIYQYNQRGQEKYNSVGNLPNQALAAPEQQGGSGTVDSGSTPPVPPRRKSSSLRFLNTKDIKTAYTRDQSRPTPIGQEQSKVLSSSQSTQPNSSFRSEIQPNISFSNSQLNQSNSFLEPASSQPKLNKTISSRVDAYLGAASAGSGNQGDDPVTKVTQNPQNPSYKYIVRNKPCYNTSTQTDDTPGKTVLQDLPHETRHVLTETGVDCSKEDKCVQARSTLINSETQNEQINTAFTQYDLNKSAEKAADQSSVPGGRDACHRVGPIVEKMEQQHRIPATIREVSQEEASPRFGRPSQRTAKRPDNFNLEDSVIAQINEHSTNDTWMLRKLSQEFYGPNSGKYKLSTRESNKYIIEPDKPRRVSNEPDEVFTSGSGTSPLPPELFGEKKTNKKHHHRDTADSGFYSRDDSQDQSSIVHSRSSLYTSADSLMEKEPPRNFERFSTTQMSLKKAYGNFEPLDNFDERTMSPDQQLVNHGKSASTSQVPSKIIPLHKSHNSFESPLAPTRKTYRFVSHWASNSQPVQKQADPVAPSPGEGVEKSNGAMEARVKRTASEQLRKSRKPEFDQLLPDKHKKSHSLSETRLRTSSSRDHQGSRGSGHYIPKTSPEYLSKTSPELRSKTGGVPGHDNRLSSDPSQPVSVKEESSPTTGQKNRLNSDPDNVFSGDRHNRKSNPDLRKTQQKALVDFFESKTGRRLSSSSSMDSGSEKSNIGDKFIGRRESTRSPSPPRPVINNYYKKEIMRKSKSLPRDTVPPWSSKVAEDRRKSSSSSRSAGEDDSVHLSYQDTSLDISTSHSRHSSLDTASPISRVPATYSPEDRRKSAGTAPNTLQEVSQSEAAKESPTTNTEDDTIPKTYEYSSSSSGSPSPTKANVPYDPNYSYQVTVNQSYTEQDEDDETPPTLPPRNYRTRVGSGDRFDPFNKSATNLTKDFDCTPKPDHYADQLRQQARRISQSGNSLLSSARYTTKPITDIKPRISVSRPVDKPPSAQEARAPQPIYRASAVPNDLNAIGLSDGANKKTSPHRIGSQESPRSSFEEEPPVGESSPRQIQHSPGVQPRSPVDYEASSRRLSGRSSSSDLPLPLPPRQSPSSASYHDDRPLPPPPPDDATSPQNLAKSPDCRTIASSPGISPPSSKAQYSDGSYMQTRGNVRQGFAGNYRRQGDLSPSAQMPAFSFSESQSKERSPHSSISPKPLVPSNMAAEKPASEIRTEFVAVKSSPVTSEHSWSHSSPDMSRPATATDESPCPAVTSPPPLTERKPSFRQTDLDSVGVSQGSSSSCSSNGRDSELQEQYSESPSVRDVIANIQNRKSSPRDSDSTPVSRCKVSELTDTWMRRSHENLTDISDQDLNRNKSNPPVSKLIITPRKTETIYLKPHKELTEKAEKVDDKKEPIKISIDTSLPLANETDKKEKEEQEHKCPDEAVPDSKGQQLLGVEDLEKQPLPFIHRRKKSQQELDYDRHAALIAKQLKNENKELSAVILPPPEHKTATDYMTGIFDVNVDLSHRSAQSSTESDHQHDTRKASVASCSSTSSNDEGQRETNDVDALDRQKNELVSRIEKKLEILSDEKTSLKNEIKENEQLGHQVTTTVEANVKTKQELAKYKLYVDELDKVMHLLLKLSGRLARTENALQSLPQDASEKEQADLRRKRDEVAKKHEDAKELKEGIDRRSHQVAIYLKKYLTPEQLADYEHFIGMKSKLRMDQQEIEDKIKLGQEQLEALKTSMKSQTS